jgi:hypothetical protein
MRKLHLWPALSLTLVIPAGQAILPPAALASQDEKPAATPEVKATAPQTAVCKEEFRLDPEKWIRAAAAPPAETPSKDASAVPT